MHGKTHVDKWLLDSKLGQDKCYLIIIKSEITTANNPTAKLKSRHYKIANDYAFT